jgi:hypothetical protein
MKMFVLALLLGVLLLVGGCTKKSTEPEKKTTEDYTLQATQSIGSDGGTIEVDDFSLVVPAGAFASNAGLKLYASSEDKPFGDNGVSRTFRLEGLPEEFSESLQVCIGYQGTLTEESFIAVGEQALVIGEDSLQTIYSMYPAADSSGFLVCKLPPEESAGGMARVVGHHSVPKGSGSENYFTAIANYKAWVGSGHFIINCPLYLIDYVDDVAKFLEAGHDTVFALGLGYEKREWAWPGEVVIKVLRSDKYLILKADRAKAPKINLDESKMSLAEISNYRKPLGFAMVEVAQFIYVPDDCGNIEHLWWNAAVRWWSEEKFVDSSSYAYPDEFPGYEMAPFNGLRVGGMEFIKKWGEHRAVLHGAGMSTLVKFLVGKYGQEILVNIYDEMKDCMKEPVEAILTSVPGPEYVWWPEFFKKYIAGEIYGVKSETFLDNISQQNKFRIDGAADTVEYFDNSYPDLSAELHRIDLVYDGFSDDATLNFKVGPSSLNLDYVTVMVFGLKDGKLEYLGDGADLTLTDSYNDLKANGYNTLVAAVINSANEPPYTGDLNIQLDVRVITQHELAYNWCRIAFYADMHFSVGDTADYWDEKVVSWEGEGGFSGNTFTATWYGTEDPNDHSKISSGSMTVEVDPVMTDSFDVVSFSATKTSDRPEGGYPEEASISGSDIPFDEFDDFYNLFLRCLIVGTEACTKVGSFEYESSYPTYGERVIGYQCNTESEVRIVFWEWHGE